MNIAFAGALLLLFMVGLLASFHSPAHSPAHNKSEQASMSAKAQPPQ